MTKRPDLGIGDFARRTRLPVSTLRYYDKIGLLVPAAVDPSSGYRHYTADQLRAAMLIAELSAIGMNPERIGQVIKGGEEGSEALARERSRLRRELLQRQRALARLDNLYPARMARYTPTFVYRPAVRVAAEMFATAAADVENTVLRAVARLRGRVRRAALDVTGPFGATFPLTVEDEIRGLAFAPIGSPVGAYGGHSGDRDATVDVQWLAPGPAVCVEHRGGGATVRHAYRTGFAALDELGVDPCEPVIEEYLGIALTNKGKRGPDVIRIHLPYDVCADQERR